MIGLIQMLLERGVEGQDDALIQAAYVGNGNLVRILRDEAGANVHHADDEAMFAAFESGSADVVEALLEGDVVITEEDIGVDLDESFLRSAVRHGLPFVKLVIDRGVITIRPGDRYNEHCWDYQENRAAVYFAVTNGDVELVRYLLENGVQLDGDFYDFPSLALYRGKVETHNFLVQHVIDAAVDREELIVEAVSKDFPSMLEGLRKVGVSVEEVDRKAREKGGMGLLLMAVLRDSPGVVPILLKTLDCSDEHLMAALIRSRTEIIKTFLSHKGGNISISKEKLLFTAVEYRYEELVTSLLESDPNLRVSDDCIFVAAQRGCTGIVKALFNHNRRRSVV
ncbi:hypothetical protein HK102_011181 [Quaeritorhiza haematococci]|nr:hypothetical protein HK102_011181 [Quaeritorhiza haematococci]